jgi:hypothetical protein
VSLSEKVALVLLAAEAGAVKEGHGFLHSRRVSSRWILGRACQGGCGFLKARKRRIYLASGPDSVHDRCGRQSRHVVVLGLSVSHGQVMSGSTPYLARSDLGSLHALQVGQVWVRFMLYKQIRSEFARCLAGRVSQSRGSTMLASGHHR